MTARRIRTTPADRASAGAVAACGGGFAALILASLVVGVGTASAAAAPVEPPVASPTSPTRLTVTSDRGMPARFAAFSPGDVERWRVDVALAASADLDVRLRRSGVLAERPDGLAVEMAVCSTTWLAAGECAGRRTGILPTTPLAAAALDEPLAVGRYAGGTSVHLLVTVSLPDSAAARTDDTLMGQTATVDLDVDASGGLPGDGGPGAPGGGVRPTGPAGADGAGGGAGSGTLSGSGDGSSGSGSASGSGPFGVLPGQLAWTGTSVGLVAGLAVGLLSGGAALILRHRSRGAGRRRRRGDAR